MLVGADLAQPAVHQQLPTAGPEKPLPPVAMAGLGWRSYPPITSG